MSEILFSDRIQRRSLVWWGKPNKWRRATTYRHLLHTVKENHSLRSRNDPDSRWRCCALWQRTLSNKWNAREFAARHGCRVPALYWSGRRIAALPVESLPEQFVIRPIWGTGRQGIYVMANGNELLSGQRFTPQQLRERLLATRGRMTRFPIMAEEFVRTESGEHRLPTEYKFHMFGETVGAIEVIHRSTKPVKATERFFTAEFAPIADRMNTTLQQDRSASDPPKCLDDLLTCARRLGAAFGTYVRVDCYATDHGAVFGEFSSSPVEGRHFTPYANEYFGALWQQAFPDRT